MTRLSEKLKRRIVIAVTSEKYGKELIDAIEGEMGSVWFTGAGIPAGTLGNDNDFYLNSINGDYYQKIDGTWVLQGNLSGGAGGSISDSGKATLTNGSATVLSSAISSTSKVMLTAAGNQISGRLHYDTVVDGVSFNIHTGNPSDIHVIDWIIIN